MQASGSTAQRSTAGQSLERSYRLIDGSCEPHLQLDGQYSSLDDAIADAIEWIGLFSEPDHPSSWIGVAHQLDNDYYAYIPGTGGTRRGEHQPRG